MSMAMRWGVAFQEGRDHFLALRHRTYLTRPEQVPASGPESTIFFNLSKMFSMNCTQHHEAGDWNIFVHPFPALKHYSEWCGQRLTESRWRVFFPSCLWAGGRQDTKSPSPEAPLLQASVRPKAQSDHVPLNMKIFPGCDPSFSVRGPAFFTTSSPSFWGPPPSLV